MIAVADAHGELLALLRLDGAGRAPIQIAMNKAFTAARERRATFEIGREARHPERGFDIAYYGDPRYVGWGGGVPVRPRRTGGRRRRCQRPARTGRHAPRGARRGRDL